MQVFPALLSRFAMPTESPADPKVGQVRAAMRPEIRHRSVVQAIGVLAPSLALYLAALAGTVLVPWEFARAPLALLTGFALALLFVIAHDAAHDALTPYRRLNAILARLLFVPAWHPYTGWVHAHNHIHHGFTNLSPVDYVWMPLSQPEYGRLPAWQRFFVRLFRWWPGFGLYYATQIHLARMVMPQRDVRSRKQRMWWYLDIVIVLVGVTLQATALVVVARSLGVTTSAAWLLLWGLAVPYATTMWLLGFLTYLHHTHPQIPWFKDQEEWSFYRGQVLGTTHVRFGTTRGINAAIHNIMEHTAHHADPRIPLYHLPDAQEDLESAFAPDVVEQTFTFRSFVYAQRVCQLYDYDNHRWLSYAGEPTSSRTFELPQTDPRHDKTSEHSRPNAAPAMVG
jgi:omega-6 fatty acid desaturase (delta-12 desaturase)